MYLVTFDKIEYGKAVYKCFDAADMDAVVELINDLVKDFPHLYTLTGIFKKTA